MGKRAGRMDTSLSGSRSIQHDARRSARLKHSAPTIANASSRPMFSSRCASLMTYKYLHVAQALAMNQ